nr:acetyltransferase [Pseudomonas sp. MWU13-2100]
MNHKLNTYGVSIVERPKIKATKKLDLGGDPGKRIVFLETRLVLTTHKKTFRKLADM